ncbi:MAG: hypothetical protein JSU86_11070, partial [Phycisphaerales bacterium]
TLGGVAGRIVTDGRRFDPPGTNTSLYDDERLGQRERVLQRLTDKPGRSGRARPGRTSSADDARTPALVIDPGYDGPHMVDGRVICGRCHGISDQPGGHEGQIEGQVNLCTSCHTGGGQAMDTPVHELDMAGGSDGRGRSHAWGVPAINEGMGSVGPPPGSELERRLDGGDIKCGTCHNPHNNDADSPYMRINNDNGAMCRECHVDHIGHTPSGDWQPICAECHDMHGSTSENLALMATSVENQTLTLEKPVVFTAQSGSNSFNDGDPAANDGICQVCHTATSYHLHDGSGAPHNDGTTCTMCHPHAGGFMPVAGACDSCHGQPPDGATFPNTAGAHATHVSGIYGPGAMDCFACHGPLSAETHINGAASFATGVDANADGHIDLSEATVCDSCHSPDGPINGVAEARTNWASGLRVGCAGCHDTGISTIQGVSAPPVAGDDSTWGYYSTGHGRGGGVVCGDCHDANAPHIDGVARTYVAADDNYQAAFRLRSVGGLPPLKIPRVQPDSANPYDDPPMWELCLSCHDRYALFGGPTAPPGPYYAAEFGTNFRSDASVIIPDGLDTDIAIYSMTEAADFNAHYEHVVGPPQSYDSDHDGQVDSYSTCVACHNVHGGTSPAMVRDGKLIGMEPALAFSYVRYDRHDPPVGACTDPIIMTSAGDISVSQSHGGVMRSGSGPVANGVCNYCHASGSSTGDPEYEINCYSIDAVDYYREPLAIAAPSLSRRGTPVNNGDGLPPGGRRAVAASAGNPSDFGNTSHHVRGQIQGSDCVVCHEMSEHQKGHVRLKDPDDNLIVYDHDTAAEE